MKHIIISLTLIATWISFASADIWTDLSEYKMGDNAEAAPRAVHELILQTAPDKMEPIEKQLIAVLETPGATHEAKEYCFRMLDRIGTDRSVPILAKYLGDEKLSLFARRSLEFRQESALAGEALVRALPQLPDALKIGVIGSLGRRSDAGVVSAITPYASSNNIALAKASLFALGQLGGVEAHDAIMKARVTRDIDDARAETLIAAAKEIKDPGSIYALGRSIEPLGGVYVQSHGVAGWKGEYFNNRNFSGTPVLVRQDSVLNFDWKQGSPSSEVGKNDFTVRWTGTLCPPETRVYEFNVNSDDGVQFSINGEAVFDHLRGGYRGTASKELEAGVEYQVEVKFVEGGGDARCQLTWDCALPESIAAGRQKIINIPLAEQQRAVLNAYTGVDVKIAQQLFENAVNRSVRLEAFGRLVELDARAAQAALNQTLADETDPIRQSLIRAVMELNKPSLQDQLVGTLVTASKADQLTILGAILDLRLSQYESEVLPLLSSTEGIVLNQVVYTLGYVGGEASFKPLYEAFQRDENPAITFAITQLQLPAVDAHLLDLVSGKTGADLDSRLAAVTPLVLRNPDGAPAVFGSLVAVDQPEAVRKAGFKAIESAGSVENCKRLAELIVADDVMKRQAQQALKKAALRINKGHDVWHSAFKPTLTSASTTQSQKESLLVIIDGVPAGDSLNFLKKKIMAPSDPLRPMALRMLGRWPEAKAGDVWVELAAADFANESDQKTALKGLTRILTRDEIEGDANRRLKLALKAIESAPSTAYKLEILKCFQGSESYTRSRMKEHFAPLMSDSELAPAIEALMENK